MAGESLQENHWKGAGVWWYLHLFVHSRIKNSFPSNYLFLGQSLMSKINIRTNFPDGSSKAIMCLLLGVFVLPIIP